MNGNINATIRNDSLISVIKNDFSLVSGFPLDPRTVISGNIGNQNLYDNINNIDYPYPGLMTYNMSNKKMYLIKSVNDANENLKVDEYTEFMGLPHYPSADQTGFIPQVSDDDITEINWVDPSGIIDSCINNNETIKNSIKDINKNFNGYEYGTKYLSVSSETSNFIPSSQYKIYEYTVKSNKFELPSANTTKLSAGYYSFENWVTIEINPSAAFSKNDNIKIAGFMIAPGEVLESGKTYVFERIIKKSSDTNITDLAMYKYDF